MLRIQFRDVLWSTGAGLNKCLSVFIMTAVTMMTCREYGVDSEIGMEIMKNLMTLVLVLVVLRNKYLVVKK